MDQKVMEILANIYQMQTEMRGELKELRTDVTEIKIDVAGLKTDVAELKTDVAELKTDVAELKTDVAELKTDVAELKTDVAGLKIDVTEIRIDVAGLRKDQETTARNVVKIITVVEHDIARKIGVLFDFREIQIEHNQRTGQALERIEAKLEVLQLETSNLRRIK